MKPNHPWAIAHEGIPGIIIEAPDPESDGFCDRCGQTKKWKELRKANDSRISVWVCIKPCEFVR